MHCSSCCCCSEPSRHHSSRILFSASSRTTRSRSCKARPSTWLHSKPPRNPIDNTAARRVVREPTGRQPSQGPQRIMLGNFRHKAGRTLVGQVFLIEGIESWGLHWSIGHARCLPCYQSSDTDPFDRWRKGTDAESASVSSRTRRPTGSSVIGPGRTHNCRHMTWPAAAFHDALQAVKMERQDEPGRGAHREKSGLGRLLRSCRLAVLVTVAGLVSVGGATFQSPPRWKTGKEFERALNAVVRDVVWSAGTSVRQAVTTLARTQGVAIMLDRRIDPESAIELSVHDVTLHDVIEQLAAQCDAAPCYLDDVAYLGPRVGLGDLPAVANDRRVEAQSCPRPVARRLLAERAWRWEELAEPRNLLEDLAREANVTIEGVAELPHDLWPAMDLPAAGVDRPGDTGPGGIRQNVRIRRRREADSSGADSRVLRDVEDLSGRPAAHATGRHPSPCFRRRRSKRTRNRSRSAARRKNMSDCDSSCRRRRVVGHPVVRRERPSCHSRSTASRSTRSSRRWSDSWI